MRSTPTFSEIWTPRTSRCSSDLRPGSLDHAADGGAPAQGPAEGSGADALDPRPEAHPNRRQCRGGLARRTGAHPARALPDPDGPHHGARAAPTAEGTRTMRTTMLPPRPTDEAEGGPLRYTLLFLRLRSEGHLKALEPGPLPYGSRPSYVPGAAPAPPEETRAPKGFGFLTHWRQKLTLLY